VPSSTPRHEQNSSCSSSFFAFTLRAGFLGAGFSLSFIDDEGREVLPFSLPEGCVDTLRERVVRMLAAAAAAVAARVGMGAVVECTTKSGEKKKNNFFHRFLTMPVTVAVVVVVVGVLRKENNSLSIVDR
jgi:hypothetical protein